MVADNPNLKIPPRLKPQPQPRAIGQIELLSMILQEQQKTNELLAALVDALAEDGGDPDTPPARYLDGTLARG